MFVRALVILLLVLNLGVAAWWVLHSPSPAPALEALPLGVARLQLLSEAGRPAPTPQADVLQDPTPTPEPAVAKATAALQCFSFGPFLDRPAADAARARLLALVSRSAVREQGAASGGKGWRVLVPPQASPAEAQALAQRITAAGFSDLFVVREGNEANSIALGRYRSEDTARRRADALTAAGFAARAEPLGETRTEAWVDIAAPEAFDAPGAQKASGATQRRDIDCSAVR